MATIARQSALIFLFGVIGFFGSVGCDRRVTDTKTVVASPVVAQGQINAMANPGADAEEKFYRSFRYHVVGPMDHRLSLWAECWRDGGLDAMSPLSRGRWYVPPRGKGLNGYFEFNLVSGKQLGSGVSGKVRWEWKEDWQPGGVKGGEWITDPFSGLATCSTWDEKSRWTPSAGETCLLLVLRGDQQPPAMADSHDEELAKRSKVCLLLKMRFDVVKPGEQHSELNGGPLDVQSMTPR